jgi:hypothetical protein
MAGHGEKITLGEMRETGVRGMLIYCSDFLCSHWVRLSAADCDRWPDDIRLSDLERSCAACAASAGPGSDQTSSRR